MWRPESTSRQPAPTFQLDHDDSVSTWTVTAQEWIRSRGAQLDNLCTNVAVFDSEGRILLVQRASHDYWMPNHWEIPGGSAEYHDKSILHGAVRELWEETRLVATRIKRVIPENAGLDGGYAFRDGIRSLSFCRFSFEIQVETCEGVVLDPTEHQAYVWASEREVHEQRIGERRVPITDEPMRALILEAFRLSREAQ
jgi:8-oxo-dGTP pyrophosphatase MutT (NUDIX family)